MDYGMCTISFIWEFVRRPRRRITRLHGEMQDEYTKQSYSARAGKHGRDKPSKDEIAPVTVKEERVI